jgi:hypothetical protein
MNSGGYKNGRLGARPSSVSVSATPSDPAALDQADVISLQADRGDSRCSRS